MRILFAISSVALIALLWASFSIAGHVRRARRLKRQGLVETATPFENALMEPQTLENELPAHEPPPPPLYCGEERRSPENAEKRADWAYFNKDMGDLSDPYQAPRARPKPRVER